ncbi:MAG: ribosome maturation factor RimP [Bradymonadaceae bacterium]|nr:ribosome maturation factor RimP [Lujinxingiaceae bacterium]
MSRKRKVSDTEHEEAQEKPEQGGFLATPELLADIESWSEEAAHSHGLLLYDVDIRASGRWIIRIYVDRPDAEPGKGVMVDDCVEVSRYVEAHFDADERMPENYVLEVSSPGVERALKKARHVTQVVGSLVELVVREQIDGSNKLVGKLLSFEDEVMTIQASEQDSVITIPWSAVSKAKLKYDFSGVKDQ